MTPELWDFWYHDVFLSLPQRARDNLSVQNWRVAGRIFEKHIVHAIAQKEREECAKLAEISEAEWRGGGPNTTTSLAIAGVVAAIRARGKGEG